jgi:hypothetical protein
VSEYPKVLVLDECTDWAGYGEPAAGDAGAGGVLRGLGGDSAGARQALVRHASSQNGGGWPVGRRTKWSATSVGRAEVEAAILAVEALEFPQPQR